jgi:hypothetical protein
VTELRYGTPAARWVIAASALGSGIAFVTIRSAARVRWVVQPSLVQPCQDPRMEIEASR